MKITEGQRTQFINEILDVCRKHGLSISHEDCHGGFIVEKFTESNAQWLGDARVENE